MQKGIYNSTIVRTTISVPKDLKRRMKGAPVNWSKVASLAFESVLSEINSTTRSNGNVKNPVLDSLACRVLEIEQTAKLMRQEMEAMTS